MEGDVLVHFPPPPNDIREREKKHGIPPNTLNLSGRRGVWSMTKKNTNRNARARHNNVRCLGTTRVTPYTYFADVAVVPRKSAWGWPASISVSDRVMRRQPQNMSNTQVPTNGKSRGVLDRYIMSVPSCTFGGGTTPLPGFSERLVYALRA